MSNRWNVCRRFEREEGGSRGEEVLRCRSIHMCNESASDNTDGFIDRKTLDFVRLDGELLMLFKIVLL